MVGNWCCEVFGDRWGCGGWVEGYDVIKIAGDRLGGRVTLETWAWLAIWIGEAAEEREPVAGRGKELINGLHPVDIAISRDPGVGSSGGRWNEEVFLLSFVFCQESEGYCALFGGGWDP